MRKPFRVLKRKQNCKRAVQKVGKNRYRYAKTIALKSWLRRYIQLDAGRR